MNECPKCKRSDFSKAIQAGYANVRPENAGVFHTGSELVHVFCLNCGFITESYVKKPEKFRPDK
ncbi:transcription initiation factor TFIIIB [Paenibacillus eucommiae]|uniref:Nucleic-acid-binding Zn-ribbon protein n=1 Tax=Paenibacillus eucommiae TaxID=1355755 RepID=A0ABS4IWF9_9BACL|nr:transcription initiation factor TFIIIB [Paenibacillus eucommiae]MBP1991843.1 putative nucleic-acid-binding Zn-ribbon protein [Paenibacillus eucommiae]